MRRVRLAEKDLFLLLPAPGLPIFLSLVPYHTVTDNTMGLLKHAVCPFFALTHGFAGLSVLLGATPASFAKMFGMPNDGPQDMGEEAVTLRENTLLVIVGAFHLASAALMSAATFWESAHVRGLVMMYETISCGGNVLLGATRLPRSKLVQPAGMFILALGSTIIHAMEPGIFTKDKGGSK